MFLNYKMSQHHSLFEYPGPKLVKNPPISEDNIRLEIIENTIHPEVN